jgi:predicted ATP-grasp superfamily ATP-dependent carboligase
LNLLILEYFSGGGYADQKLSASILSEAYGMGRSLISDCKAAEHNVTTLLDSRIKEFNSSIEADKIVTISSPKEFYAKLEDLSGRVDAVYVIAPESGQVLEKLVGTVEASGGTSLNCEIDAIKRVSNKMRTYDTLKQIGLKTPETVLLDINEKTENISHLTNELGYPMVFKPLDGISCDGVSILKDGGDLAGAVKKVALASMNKQFIAQKLISGEAASACVISTGDRALSVTLNRQFVTLASPDEQSGYYGGAVPFDHKLEEKALKAAEKAVEAVSGLKGYVGIDMILTDKEPIIIEINPRLTVSYIGLRKAANFNPAETIISAVIRRKLPSNIQNRGYVFFAKVQVPSLPQKSTETYRLKNVVSPPFPIEENTAYALIAASSSSSRGAQSTFYRTKKRFLKLYSRGD